MAFQFKKCNKCNKDMQPIPVKSRIESSEWYCRACHHSILMKADDANYVLELRKAQAAAQG